MRTTLSATPVTWLVNVSGCLVWDEVRRLEAERAARCAVVRRLFAD
jgi:hypothetical protein